MKTIQMFKIALSMLVSATWTTPSHGASSCLMTKPSGPFSLSISTVKAKKPFQKKLKLIGAMINTEIKAIAGFRLRYSKYCYNGGNIDPNTGCKRSNRYDDVSVSEAEQWANKKKCNIGIECKPYGDCWGSGAQQCHNEKKDKWVTGQGSIKWMEDDWTKFAFHTCIRSWACNFNVGKFQLALGGNNSDKFILNHKAKTHFLEKTKRTFIKLDDGGFIYTLEIPQMFHIEEEALCTQDGEKEEYICMLESEKWGKYRHSAIIVSKHKYSNFKGLVVKVKRSINADEEVNPLYNEIDRAISKNDYNQLSATIKAMHAELLYAQYHTELSMQNMQDVSRKAILSSAKINDELIGDVINRPLKTKFINKDTFMTYPCFDPHFNNSNCQGEYIFKEGRTQMRTKKDVCYTEGNVLKEIPIFNEFWEDSFAKLEAPPPEGTSDSSEGWSHYAENKEKLQQSMSTYETISNNQSVLGSIAAMGVDALNNWTLLGKITVFLNWFPTVVCAIIVVKWIKER